MRAAYSKGKTEHGGLHYCFDTVFELFVICVRDLNREYLFVMLYMMCRLKHCRYESRELFFRLSKKM